MSRFGRLLKLAKKGKKSSNKVKVKVRKGKK